MLDRITDTVFDSDYPVGGCSRKVHTKPLIRAWTRYSAQTPGDIHALKRDSAANRDLMMLGPDCKPFITGPDARRNADAAHWSTI